MTDFQPRVSEGLRIYAVGDIHGRADLLARLHRRIAADAATHGGALAAVYLGDYVDRGRASSTVLATLADGPPAGIDAVFLKGNHEDMLTHFLDDGAMAATWLANGGIATLASYGIEAPPRPRDPGEIDALRRALREAMDPAHHDFLRRLRPCHGIGDYLFVHAGVRPGVPLDEQDPQDLMWIRRPFMDSPEPFGRMIVHGHTIVPEPDVRPNRIGIDTGAYQSDRLTCLVLEGATRRFLST